MMGRKGNILKGVVKIRSKHFTTYVQYISLMSTLNIIDNFKLNISELNTIQAPCIACQILVKIHFS